jgi:hypothetical protein
LSYTVNGWPAGRLRRKLRQQLSWLNASQRGKFGKRDKFFSEIVDCIRGKPLNQFDASEQRLMKLVLNFAHVAMAVELQREEEPKHAQYRPYMRITRAPADQQA